MWGRDESRVHLAGNKKSFCSVCPCLRLDGVGPCHWVEIWSFISSPAPLFFPFKPDSIVLSCLLFPLDHRDQTPAGTLNLHRTPVVVNANLLTRALCNQINTDCIVQISLTRPLPANTQPLALILLFRGKPNHPRQKSHGYIQKRISASASDLRVLCPPLQSKQELPEGEQSKRDAN